MSGWYQGPVSTGSLGELIAEHGAPDAVVHAAGSSSVRVAAEDPAEDFRRTVDGTAELLEALRRWAPQARLLLSSSAAIYGNDHRNPIAEDAAPAPISIYGLHKLRAEELCLEAAEQHGLQVAIIRFFSLYGAGLRKQIFWDLWNKITGGNPIVLGGTGNESRDFLHVRDAVLLLLHIAEHADIEAPLIINGGTGRPTTIRDAASLMVRLSDCRAEIVFEGLSRPGDPAHLVAHVGRLRATGYRSRIELADGMADYVAWAAEGGLPEAASRRAPIGTRMGAL
jgi:UDP-glucose 4-epimerase